MEPLARVELSSLAPAEVLRLLPLVGLEPVSRVRNDASSSSVSRDSRPVAIRVIFSGHARSDLSPIDAGDAPATIAVAFDSNPTAETGSNIDFVTGSAIAAVSFILSRTLGLASPFLTADGALFEVICAATTLARQPARILVEGELGVGKKSLIKLIYAAGCDPLGSRAGREPPDHQASGLLHAECAGLSANAVESEIAPLLAQAAEFNRSDTSNRGAVFFNRLGELSPRAQLKLLDLLRSVTGAAPGTPNRHRNIRILAASTRPLGAMVADGDLLPELHQLFDATLRISPLCSRRGDVPLLSRHYLRGLNSPRTFNAAALRALAVYPFPGNTLELINFVTRLAIIPPKAAVQRTPLGESTDSVVGRSEVISQLDCGNRPLRRTHRQRACRIIRTPRSIGAPLAETPNPPAPPSIALPASLRLTTSIVPRKTKPRGGHRPTG
ncbi:MAG TPA: sigma 54-interacting transcriptional regulator [Candidatus Binataceae bacterium]|nr:sigma 54-interacting transcriptional regulator [Candidatus Binataceae bacterium]